jgi:hypothetical protein
MIYLFIFKVIKIVVGDVYLQIGWEMKNGSMANCIKSVGMT